MSLGAGLLVFLNSFFDLSLSEKEMGLIITVVLGYVATEGAADYARAKGGE